ncbi:MAG: DUF1564 family protein, partial [Leptospiraceae bacterium]|nr:DUF1564 family protein [Leptospiraceae bacterium]
EINPRGKVASLLIPEELYLELIQKWGKRKLQQRLRFLLLKYRKYISLSQIPRKEKSRITYQDKDQNLIRVRIRPVERDWIELGIIAYSHGVSA